MRFANEICGRKSRGYEYFFRDGIFTMMMGGVGEAGG